MQEGQYDVYTHVCAYNHMCTRTHIQTHDQMVEVFDNPDVVMTKFIQTIIDKVLQVPELVYMYLVSMI